MTMLDTALREAIRKSGKTQHAIAEEAGIHAESVYRFLTAKRDLRLHSAARIARVLGYQLVKTAK
jgi:DNA-binding phage protein